MGSARELLQAVRVVAHGDALLAPSVTRRLIAEFATRAAAPAPPAASDELTPREGEITDLVATGCSNNEIAATLMISSATLKTHITRILAKLKLRDRAQLAVWAYESGRVRPEWFG